MYTHRYMFVHNKLAEPRRITNQITYLDNPQHCLYAYRLTNEK